ncbi:carbohydrate ABC transporter permease [Lacrimispora sp. 38-1]|uniref:carbohydrate ABC transporter permease n=1 Tax=Lacrimispora sp. 38-1 TaxID=3125778 RepID=UPI003CF02507
MRKRKLYGMILNLILCLCALIILIPVFMVVINSFKDQTEAAMMNMKLPSNWHIFENYKEMIKEGGIFRGFVNSTVITVICVLMLIILCSTMAFVLERRKTFFSKMINMTVIFGLVLPLQIIPTYFVCNYLHLTHEVAAVLVLIVANMSFTVFLYTGFVKSIPIEIDESAWIDGAGYTQLFFEIIFPLLQPVTVTAVIINFMAVWNDFGISIYFLNSARNYTLPLTVYNFFGNHSSDWQLVFANVVLSTLPVAIVYLILQRHIISGMTSGAVKG